MSDSCPACSEPRDRPGQHFCGHCGEPLNVKVDRERIRRNASGFLQSQTAKMLVNTINSKRNHNHEYTAVAVQEAARKALGDFMLVAHWDRVDNSEVFFSDGFGHPSDDEFKTQITGLYSLFQLLYAQNGVDLVSVFLAMAVLDDCDVSAEQIDVEVTIDGERINSDPSEVLVTLDSD